MSPKEKQKVGTISEREENLVITFIPKVFYLSSKTDIVMQNQTGKSKLLSQHKPDYKVKGKADNFTNLPSFK